MIMLQCTRNVYRTWKQLAVIKFELFFVQLIRTLLIIKNKYHAMSTSRRACLELRSIITNIEILLSFTNTKVFEARKQQDILVVI